MAYLYLTKDYKEKHDNPEMDAYHEKIRTSDNLIFIKEFSKTTLWKMSVKPQGSHRLILKKEVFDLEEGKQEVFCAKYLFRRNSHEYKKWYRKLKKKRENEPFDDDELKEIKDWLKGLLEEEKAALELKPLVDNEELKKFVDKAAHFYLSDSDVYESQEWLTAIKEKTQSVGKKELKQFYEQLCSFVMEVYTSKQDEIKQASFEVIAQKGVFMVAQKEGLFIIYAKFESEFESKTQLPNLSQDVHKITFLFHLCSDEETAIKLLEKTATKYPYTSDTKHKVLLRGSKRIYDDLILADSKSWRKIHENEKANLALSMEEREILENPSFPMFINGQAGSGKSTILYYLFAHFYTIPYPNPHPTPNCLFFTYNEDLLDRAEENIMALLQHNDKYLVEPVNTDQLGDSFYTLHNFIRTHLLRPEEANYRFSTKKYLSFGMFKECYLGKSEVQKYHYISPNPTTKPSPDLVWHIIRTYIKGYNLHEASLSLECYRNLNEREQSVSDDDYQKIWEIWQSWYKKFGEEGFWDDQDLIRYVLKKARKLPHSPVLFCDEIQDFTRIELELLCQLSSFTQHTLENQKFVPFIFAGDPNQTVHPTGFQWNNLRDAFLQRLKDLGADYSNIPLQQLSKNYRSKSSIIQFSNLIQRFRHDFLEISEIKHQIPWQQTEGFTPCFIHHQDLELKDIEMILKKALVLIPTSRSEDEYIRKNPLLKQIIPPPKENEEDNQNKSNHANPSNGYKNKKEKQTPNGYKIMNVASAKGLEFETVVLYNFGDHAPACFQKCVEKTTPLTYNEKIELIHFFSKLYVAVSRARDYLFVIDTEKGLHSFWKYFMEEGLISFEKNENWDKACTTFLTIGTKDDIENLKDQNPKKIAKALHKSGKNKKDSNRLWRAQQFYQSIQMSKKALTCEAWKHWYRGEWTEAGRAFAQLNKHKKAAKSFWKGQEWSLLKNVYEAYKPQHPRLLMAKYMLEEVNFGVLLDNPYVEKKCSADDESWVQIVTQLQKDFSKKIQLGFADFAPYAEKMAEKGFADFFDIAGNLYFKDKMFEAAIRCWDENQDSVDEDSYTSMRLYYNPSDYYNAQIAAAKNNNKKAIWYHHLKDFNALISIYKESSSKELQKLKPFVHQLIFDALIQKKQFKEALEYPCLSLNKKTNQLLENIEHFGSESKTKERKKQIFDLLLKKNDEGAKSLIEHIETFKTYFKEKEILYDIVKNSSWKDILEAFDQNFEGSNAFSRLLNDFVTHLKNKKWSKNTRKNTVLQQKFDYVIPLLTDSQKIDNKPVKFEKIFRTLIRHELGVDLICKYMDSFKPLMGNQTTLQEILNKDNWSELLHKFEGELQIGFADKYPEAFIDLVCYKLSENKIEYLPHTLQLIEPLKETNKLTYYVRLINALPKSEENSSTEGLSLMLEKYLREFVKRNSSIQALPVDLSKPKSHSK